MEFSKICWSVKKGDSAAHPQIDIRSTWISSKQIVVQDSLVLAHTVSVCMYDCMYVSLGSKHSATEMEKA